MKMLITLLKIIKKFIRIIPYSKIHCFNKYLKKLLKISKKKMQKKQ